MSTFRADADARDLLLDRAHDADYKAWVAFKHRDSHDYRALLLNSDVADAFRARALRDLIAFRSNDKIADWPPQFHDLAVRLILDEARKVDEHSHDHVNGLLLQIVAICPASIEATQAIGLIRGDARVLASLIRWHDLPLKFKRALDARCHEAVRRAVLKAKNWDDCRHGPVWDYANAALSCLCGFSYRAGAEVRKADPCDAAADAAMLRCEQVYFLAELNVPLFADFNTLDMLRNHFGGAEHVGLRRRILRLYIEQLHGVEWAICVVGHGRHEWEPCWIDDLAGAPDLLAAIDQARKRGAARHNENEQWQAENDAREVAVIARLRAMPKGEIK